jgi:disulfide bond formation protein DsbB
MNRLPLDRIRWPLVALLASAATLGVAYFFEIVLNQAPCQMCWWQRYAYFAAGPIALVAIVLKWRGAGPGLMTTLSILLALTFMTGFVIAAWHALFEWDLAPGPAGCTAMTAGALPEGIPLSDPIVQGGAVARTGPAMGPLDGRTECRVVDDPRGAEPVFRQPAADACGYGQ